MGPNANNNSGCLFPFGGDFLPLLGLLFLYEGERRWREADFDGDEENDDIEVDDDIGE
jgi:hypothetical protein